MQGVPYLILIQVVSRGFTFAGNQILLSYISPGLLGIATQFELYSVSVLYFSRESLRVALQRKPLQDEEPKEKTSEQRRMQKQAQASINVSYIACLLGFVLSLLLGASFWRYGAEDVVQSPQFLVCLQIYGLATLIELLGEPGFTVIQLSLDFKTRAAIETAAATLKCCTACSMAFVANSGSSFTGVFPFAAGQLAYASVLFLGNTIYGFKKAKALGSSLLLQPIQSQDDHYWCQIFSRKLLSLSTSLYIQSAVKQVLTQGDSFILATFSTLEEQGAFALASNYGGLVARLIFQPVEESSRNEFGRYISQSQSQKGTAEDTPEGLEVAIQLLYKVLKAYAIMSVVVTCFAPSLFPVMVHILAGDRWFSPAMRDLLATYSFYLPFLAINGITEAFVSSSASTHELKIQAIWMGTFSAGFGLAAFGFLQILDMGASGLVWANAANMLLRTTWSLRFIKTYLEHHGRSLELLNILPSPWSILSGLVASLYLRSVIYDIETFRDLVHPAVICLLGGISM